MNFRKRLQVKFSVLNFEKLAKEATLSNQYLIKKVEILGGFLEYVYIPGEKDLPTIIMLHEGLGSISTWKEFPRKLSETTRYPILLYSRHGYGSSGFIKPRFGNSYMHDEALEVLPALIYQLNIGSVILYGHSDGASIATIFAGAKPTNPVERIILEAPHVFVEDISIEGIKAAKAAFENGNLRRSLEKHHEDPDRTFKYWSEAWLDPNFFTWDIQNYAKNISAPVLLIQGENDVYGSLKQLDAIERDVKGKCSRTVLQDTGHSPHKEQPESVLLAFKNFIIDR